MATLTVVQERRRSETEHVERVEEKETVPKLEALDKVRHILDVLDTIKRSTKTTEASSIPSSLMLQILKYGKAFKYVVVRVVFDSARFDEELSKLEKVAKIVRMPRTLKSYQHRWREPEVRVPKEDVEELLKPLAELGIGDFTFRDELKVNEKFYEAVKSYVERDAVQGKVFLDEENRRLVVLAKVFSEHRLGWYYVGFIIRKTDEGRLDTTFFCTCPWAMGQVTDRRGRLIPPEYTSLCKHGLATLFHFYPEIAAFVRLAESGEEITNDRFSELANAVRDRFTKVVDAINDYISRRPSTEVVVLSNVAYILVREVYRKLSDMGSVKKYVLPEHELYRMEDLWKGLVVKHETKIVGEPSARQPSADLSTVVEKLRSYGIYEKVKQLEDLLSGLQGARQPTLYTKALLAALVLGSDLETDPVIVSVVGDPGTGKTLTAEGLARLVGVRTIVVEREVSRDSLREDARREIEKALNRMTEFFTRILLPIVPEEKRASAKAFFEEYKIVAATLMEKARSSRELVKLAKQFAETFCRLYGIESRRAKLSVAKLFYAVIKTYRRIQREYLSDRALKRKALEVRRELLKTVADLGLIARPEDKEELNGGSVRWEALETASGYLVRVKIDLHYLVRRCGGDVERIKRVIEELSKRGRMWIETEVPGIAELKLSEMEYLEKAIKVREEDVLSPSRKLIWVGGEVTKRAVILIDESRRAPVLLERLLTELSTAARDTRRTNIVVTTDNAEPLMEAEADPKLDAFHSRVNFEVITPSTTVASIISETLRKISEYEREGRVPIITMDEALLLNFALERVKMPEKYEIVLYSIPLLLVYDFKVLRPEVVGSALDVAKDRAQEVDPLILPVPKASVESIEIRGDYVDSSLGSDVPAVRMMPERRFGHHVVRAAKALAILEGKTEVDLDSFVSALRMVMLARTIPVEQQFPYLYIDAKRRFVNAVVAKVREFLAKESKVLELVEVLGSLQEPPRDLLNDALEEMIENPVATAVFVRFLEQMLVSEKAREFVELAKRIPGLYKTLDLIARYEKIDIEL